MIVCHKYKFIFIRTRKTASTSLETFLSSLCTSNDIITPSVSDEPGFQQQAYNHSGWFNPFPEIIAGNGYLIKRTVINLKRRRKYYHHIPAFVVRARISKEIWNTYYRFCVERNPWDKTLSHYHYFNKRRWDGFLTMDRYFQLGNFCFNYPIYTDPKTGRVMVDRVIKYENLIEELGEVMEGLGIPFDGSLGSNANASFRQDKRPYREVMTQKQKTIIERAFRKEIELHGYEY